jgi:flagellar biogenesis protein FliO
VAGAGAAAVLLALAGDGALAIGGRAMLAVLALAGVTWVLRRSAPGAASPRLVEVVERRPLTRDASVAVLRAGGRSFLVGCGPDGVRLLANLGASPGEERP